jgi:uncharacterized protein YceK
MMNKLLIIFALSLLSGCSTVKEWVPSFNDPNQSSRIVDVRLSVARLDCSQAQAAQVARIRDDLEWFELYSESKGWRQQDVRKVIAPMRATVEDMYTRVQIKDGSKAYCEMKKAVMKEQAARAAAVILGRF